MCPHGCLPYVLVVLYSLLLYARIVLGFFQKVLVNKATGAAII